MNCSGTCVIVMVFRFGGASHRNRLGTMPCALERAGSIRTLEPSTAAGIPFSFRTVESRADPLFALRKMVHVSLQPVTKRHHHAVAAQVTCHQETRDPQLACIGLLPAALFASCNVERVVTIGEVASVRPNYRRT